jgi:hypothetical protein
MPKMEGPLESVHLFPFIKTHQPEPVNTLRKEVAEGRFLKDPFVRPLINLQPTEISSGPRGQEAPTDRDDGTSGPCLTGGRAPVPNGRCCNAGEVSALTLLPRNPQLVRRPTAGRNRT